MQTRRRGAALEQAILDAAWAELVEVGYQEMTMAGVAERAGAAKSVLYRRWPDKFDLIRAVVEQRTPALGRLAPTGNLREDVLRVLDGVVARYRGLSVVTGVDPELSSRLRPELAQDAITQLGEALQVAGMDPAAISPRLLRLPITLVIDDLLHHIGEVDPQAITDEIFIPLAELAAAASPPKAP
ncbi:TetR/AcrR family transcriptional regulator [Nocardia sp. NBC_01327]|uniref:TetR/AcrR family transcriptional regulator n=1 Tax=Nocardia sp. NBC_01327 TaxID=2903593 RepID=UPI002E10FF50|nr:TetR/AcrR family transcriptional regulator [Nocardia sp. NBC_01327]